VEIALVSYHFLKSDNATILRNLNNHKLNICCSVTFAHLASKNIDDTARADFAASIKNDAAASFYEATKPYGTRTMLKGKWWHRCGSVRSTVTENLTLSVK